MGSSRTRCSCRCGEARTPSRSTAWEGRLGDQQGGNRLQVRAALEWTWTTPLPRSPWIAPGQLQGQLRKHFLRRRPLRPGEGIGSIQRAGDHRSDLQYQPDKVIEAQVQVENGRSQYDGRLC